MDIASREGRAKIKHVLVIEHGIRDFGEWREAIRKDLAEDNIHVVGVRYGYFDLFRFLFPFPWFRKAAIHRVPLFSPGDTSELS